MEEQAAGAAGTGAAIFMMIFYLAIFAVMIVSAWKIFEKAGKPGWAAIVPIYNIIVMLEIVGRPIWWIILLFVPCVNIVIMFILAMDMGEAFGKSRGWGFVLLGLFGMVGYPILAFTDASYSGPVVKS